MPLQNRVSPCGLIETNDARGMLMGNRGVLHNIHKELKRQYKTKAWIICLLDFEGRKRDLMSANGYTELFFLDEVTAFAAGHRPCAQCRRSRYNEFRTAWMDGNLWEGGSAIRAPEIDEVLHGERIEAEKKLTWSGRLSDLPHGAMFEFDHKSFAVCEGKILEWGFNGYSPSDWERFPANVDVLTPRSVVNVLATGFRPEFHAGAMS
ncbi:hypothetical protein FMN52_00990 [Marinobacter sp. BW6]|uniref:hypothetical protein n=1 Tax=Marinobacter sp. BW6 TaxID=2592624 RepID=UPI0011DE5B14|nr:hypothetical protein [Marinobacter sp. BW6]TYC63831.1 hypothetical protein FMN52_00990 [Marinobacter sp. BW6]